MSLRVKVEFVLFIVIGLVVALGYGIQRYAILPQLNPLEERLAQSNLEDCIEALERREASFNYLAEVWAADPDIVAFASGKAETLPESTFADGDLLASEATFTSLLAPDHTVLWKKAVDPESKNLQGVDEFLESYSRTAQSLSQADAQNSGVYLTKTAPFLVAIHPIFGKDGQGLKGRVVVGRQINRTLLSSVYDETSVAFQFRRADDQDILEEERAALDEITRLRLPVKINTSDRMFRVYAVYPDLTGAPGLLLRSDIQRNVLVKAFDAIQQGLLAQVGIGLGALVVLVILFRRAVMTPLERVTDHTMEIGETNDLSARLEMERDDEIGQLAGEFDRMVEQLEDEMEKQKSSEEALRESEERYALALRGANDGLWDWNLQTQKIYYSDRWKKMLGYEEHEIGQSKEAWVNLVHREDRENLEATLDAHLASETAHFEAEFRIRHKGDNYLWVLCRGLAIRSADGNATRMAGSMTDITLRKLVEEQLSHQALHDSLTTLPNRSLLLDRINQAMKQARRKENYVFAILFLDLDRFKVVNDGLGHAVGDILLTTVAERLVTSVRDADTVSHGRETVARFGGDEFVILLDNLADVADATFVAERILNLLSQPFNIEGHEIFVTVSIGIAINGTEFEKADELLRNADTAMYRAKAHGKARFEIFDTDMHSKAMVRLQIENDLRRAVENEEFVVYYQPIINMATGDLDAFEALIRWDHPAMGLVSPVDFIPVAEETGMIVAIGEFVMRNACRQTRDWQNQYPSASDLRISVNLSVHEFSKPNLLESVERMVSESGLNPRYLKLEITESAIMESIEFVTKTLKKLREMQIELSIDDFGTGYSSLSYLHRFPMNTLKIDQAFVHEMYSSDENFQIISTIITLAKALNMSVIAEGIETPEQADDLRKLKCEFGQGFLFSRPVPAEQAEEFIVRNAASREVSAQPTVESDMSF